MLSRESKGTRRGVPSRVAGRQRRRLRPTLLLLEGRSLLSTIVVDNPTDAPIVRKTDLRQAIELANTDGGDEAIVFDGTVFSAPQTITLAGSQLELTDTTGTVSITAPTAGVTVSGGGASRVFQVDSGVTAGFTGLTITGGSTAGRGGGVDIESGTASLTDCVISGNTSGTAGTAGGYGGGLNNIGGQVTLDGCTISNNTVEDVSGGGGLATLTDGTTTLIDCTVSDNSCDVSLPFGAAASGLIEFGLSAMTTLIGCTLSGNVARATGGGLATYFNDTAQLANCTISGNSASTGGGAKFSGPVTLTNCTVSGNSATFAGGVLTQGGATLNNTIVAGDTPSQSDFLAVSYSGSNNLLGGNPVLAPLGEYGGPTQTMPPVPGSPAIDAGSTALAVDPQGNPLTTDQRGLPRVVGGAVDIGASESQGYTFMVVPGSTPQTAAIGTAFANPLAVTVAANNPLDPVDGGIVNFTAQPAANGASAIFATPTAIVSKGVAALTAAPNNIDGTYSVVASTAGFSGSFQLTNVGSPFAALIVNTTSDSIAPGPSLLSLREAVGFADTVPSGDSVITFDRKAFKTPQVITLTGNQLMLTNTSGTVSINGPAGGVTLSGGGRSRVFQVDGGVTATFRGLTITDGSTADNGGGLYNNGGSATLIQCTISGNSASVRGGGLFESSGSLTLTQCTVSGNSAYDDGGLGLDDGVNTLNGCTISGNTATYYGGLYAVDGVNTLNGCTINGNSTTYFDGGLSLINSTNVLNNCTISGNTAGYDGGLGIAFGTSTLNNCVVSGNTSSYEDGGISLFHGTTTLSRCVITGNTAGPYGSGGGLYNGYGNTATLIDCTIQGNTAGSGGGVSNPFANASITLTDCTISNNSAVTGGGVYNAGTLTIASSRIIRNQATSEGGGIATTSGSVTLTDSAVSGNQVNSSGSALGGGIYSKDSLLTLTDDLVMANQAIGTYAYGGGIYALDSTLNAQGCTISGNKANGSVQGKGGGIYNKGTVLDLAASRVIHNKASTDGDDIFNSP